MEIRKDFSIKGTNSQFLNTLKSADVIQSVLRRRHIRTNITIINQKRALRNAHMWPSGVGAQN